MVRYQLLLLLLEVWVNISVLVPLKPYVLECFHCRGVMVFTEVELNVIFPLLML